MFSLFDIRVNDALGFGATGIPEMTISMGLRNLQSGHYEVVPVATSSVFRTVWIPLCEELKLRYIPQFHDDSIGYLEGDEIKKVIRELNILKEVAAGKKDAEFVAGRVSRMLDSIERADVANCRFDFG